MKGKKLGDGKGIGGKGRLTDKVFDRIQNYYGNAKRENSGNLEGMKKSTNAIRSHMIENNDLALEDQIDNNTWCNFWANRKNNTNTYDNSNRLPEVFMKELEPTFKRLTDDELLTRCLRNITQNQNYGVNAQLWSRFKTTSTGFRRVQIAVCETVIVFNTGAANKAVMINL